MSSVRKVLNIEKKVEQTVETSRKSAEKELLLTQKRFDEETIRFKEQTRETLEKDFKERVQQVVDQGEKKVELAKEDAQRIREDARVDETVSHIVEEVVKNV